MSKPNILQILICIFLLFGSRFISAQTLVFDVQTNTNQSVESPIFKLKGKELKLTRIEGQFHIDTIHTNDELEIYALGLVPLTHLFSSQTSDTIFEIFTLFPKVQEINEVTVLAQNIQKMDGAENVHIVDYMPKLNGFWSIRKILSTYYLCYNSDITKDSLKLENKGVEFHKDCNDALFLITTRETFELKYNQTIELKLVGDNKFFEEKIKPIIAIEDTNIYIEIFSIHNQNYILSSFDKTNKSTEVIRIFDKVAAQVAQSRYNEIIALYYRTASETENVIANGAWSGNLIELSITHALNRMITWYLKIRARPIECHSFGMLDKLITIDLRNHELYLLNYSWQDVRVLPLPAYEGKVIDVIRDYSYDRVYFIIQGKFKKLYRLDYLSNELIYIKDLQPLGAFENVKIVGSDFYFLEMTSSSYDKLYKVKITL